MHKELENPNLNASMDTKNAFTIKFQAVQSQLSEMIFSNLVSMSVLNGLILGLN